MPKEIREISNFHTGTVLNASERDISDDTAAFSLNINPLAEGGILDSIKNNRLVLTSNNSSSQLLYPVMWNNASFKGGTGYNAKEYNEQDVVIENISIFNNESLVKIRTMGTKGHIEYLRANSIEPWWEQVMVTSSNNLEFKTLEAFTSTSEYIKYQSPASATRLFTVAAGGSANDLAEKESVVITSTDGITKRYVIVDDNTTTVATGDILASASDIGSGDLSAAGDAYLIGGIAVAINTTGTESTQNDFLVQLKAAIEHANGHNGKILVSAVPTEADGNQSIILTQTATTVNPGNFGSIDITSYGRNGTTTITTDISQLTISSFAGGQDSVARTYGSETAGTINSADYTITGGASKHKYHRNNVERIEFTGDDPASSNVSFVTESVYNNAFVSHMIPRTDNQTRWITASLI